MLEKSEMRLRNGCWVPTDSITFSHARGEEGEKGKKGLHALARLVIDMWTVI